MRLQDLPAPGPKLDALTATAVMGWFHVSDSAHWAIGWNGSSIRHADKDRPVRAYSDFAPSTDWDAALHVIKRVRELGYSFAAVVETPRGWLGMFQRDDLGLSGWVGPCATREEAACHMGLRVVGEIQG